MGLLDDLIRLLVDADDNDVLLALLWRLLEGRELRVEHLQSARVWVKEVGRMRVDQSGRRWLQRQTRELRADTRPPSCSGRSGSSFALRGRPSCRGGRQRSAGRRPSLRCRAGPRAGTRARPKRYLRAEDKCERKHFTSFGRAAALELAELAHPARAGCRGRPS